MIVNVSKPKTKTMWNSLLDNMASPMATSVRCYSKPKGVFCHVYKSDEGVNVLDNYHRIFLDDPIATALINAGYEGRIVIYRDMPPVAISRWLTYQISNDEEDVSWLDSITVYTFGDVDHENLPFDCRSVSWSDTKPANVIHLNTVRSKSMEYDGLFVVTSENEEYHILPSRSCNGLVVAYEGKMLVVHVTLPQGVRPVRVRYEGKDPSSVIGKEVRVKYTEATYGQCLNNITSGVVHEIKEEGN